MSPKTQINSNAHYLNQLSAKLVAFTAGANEAPPTHSRGNSVYEIAYKSGSFEKEQQLRRSSKPSELNKDISMTLDEDSPTSMK